MPPWSTSLNHPDMAAEGKEASGAGAMFRGAQTGAGEKLIETVKSQGAAALRSFSPDDGTSVQQLLVELCAALARKEISDSVFADSVHSLSAEHSAPDALWAVWQQASSFKNVNESEGNQQTSMDTIHDRLSNGLRMLADKNVLSVDAIGEACENVMLAHAKLIDANKEKREAIRINTASLYQQSKFNLLKEEPEGFAKLITLLGDGFATCEDIMWMIGSYDLEPLRVCDICLDACAHRLLNEADVAYMFSKEKLEAILGHKLRCFGEHGTPIPEILVRLAARCVRDGLADLDVLLAHLHPTHEQIKTQAAERKRIKLARASAIRQVNLSDAGATGEEKHRREEEEMKQEREEATAEEREHSLNQRLVLATALVQERDWETARRLIRDLSNAQVDYLSHTPLRQALCEFLDELASPVFEKHLKPSATKLWPSAREECTAAADIPPDFFDVLYTLGSGLSESNTLFCTCTRVFRCHVVASLGAKHEHAAPSTEEDETTTDTRNHAVFAIGRVFMPALMLMQQSAALCAEVHSIAQLLEYPERWRALYMHRNELDREPRPALKAAMGKAENETNFTLRRISKDNARDMGRHLCAPALTAPAPMLRAVLSNVESYDNLIQPITEALRSLTPLALDVLLFSVVDLLVTSSRNKVKEDGTSYSEWLSNLARFTAIICRRFVWMEQKGCKGFEVEALLDMCVKQLRAGSSADLIFLKELLSCMAGVDIVEEVSSSQLDALSGGPLLRSYTIGASQHGLTQKQMSKGIETLKPALRTHAQTLLIELGKTIDQIPYAQDEYDPDRFPLKLVSHLVDNCEEVYIQLCEFLEQAYAEHVDEYASIVPEPKQLVQEGVPHHLALRAYRPVLRAVDLPDASLPEEERRKAVCVLDKTFGQLTDNIRSVLPDNAKDFASGDFLMLFWSCTSYDLTVPREAYTTAKKRIDASLAAQGRPHSRDDADAQRQRREREYLQELQEQLPREMAEQEKRVQELDAKTRYSSNNWFHAFPSPNTHFHIDMLLESLLLPRAELSLLDATFSAKLIDIMLERTPPSFSFVVLADHLLQSLQSLVLGTTAREAERLSVVVRSILARLNSLRTSQQQTMRGPAMCTDLSEELDSCMTHQTLVRSCYKWDKRVGAALEDAMRSSEWMEARNALLFVTKLADTFPLLEPTGKSLMDAAERVVHEDSRSDLRTIAQSTSTALQKHKRQWQSPEQFLGHDLYAQVSREEAEVNQAHGFNHAHTGTSQTVKSSADENSARKPALDPHASEFVSETRKAAGMAFQQFSPSPAADADSVAQPVSTTLPPPPPSKAPTERSGQATASMFKQSVTEAAQSIPAPSRPPPPGERQHEHSQGTQQEQASHHAQVQPPLPQQASHAAVPAGSEQREHNQDYDGASAGDDGERERSPPSRKRHKSEREREQEEQSARDRDERDNRRGKDESSKERERDKDADGGRSSRRSSRKARTKERKTEHSGDRDDEHEEELKSGHHHSSSGKRSGRRKRSPEKGESREHYKKRRVH